jgi:HlyD family secretion protein
MASANLAHEVAKPSPPQLASASLPQKKRWHVPALVCAAILVGGAAWWVSQGRGAMRKVAGANLEGAGANEIQDETRTRVEVIHPKPGGVARVSAQPGSVHPFEFAELEAKVSGYLKEQTVDIGDRVKKGQLLATIDDPEVIKEVARAKAQLELSKAQVAQAQARLSSAIASKAAVEAQVAVAEAEVMRTTYDHNYRQKEYVRIAELVKQKAVDQKLFDEQQERLGASSAAVQSALATVSATKAQVLEAEAKIEQARADLLSSKANVEVDQANLAKAQVFADYTGLTSTYDGVVTHRAYHVGEFIRSASDGATQPLLRVARTDLMRIVVLVPDVDVPFVDKGDPAVFKIVALGDTVFQGQVSRMSYAEDVSTRTMRVEVDIPNNDGRLREGMYGEVTITLQPASTAPSTVMIPAACLQGEAKEGNASVYVIRDGKAHLTKIKTGANNGIDVEVLSGLTPRDEVALPTSGSLAEGQPVEVEEATTKKK